MERRCLPGPVSINIWLLRSRIDGVIKRLSDWRSMKNRTSLLVFLFVITLPVNGRAQQSLDSMIDRELSSLVSTYKTLHAAPELSHYEEKTSSFFATQLRSL